MSDNFDVIDNPNRHCAPIRKCSCCAGIARLWRYSKDGSELQYFVGCDRSEEIGPQTSLVFSGCPLNEPNSEFYRPTQREAVKFWNDYNDALDALRASNVQA